MDGRCRGTRSSSSSPASASRGQRPRDRSSRGRSTASPRSSTRAPWPSSSAPRRRGHLPGTRGLPGVAERRSARRRATWSPRTGAARQITLPGFNGNGVTVALLDTGVDRLHPFLRGRVIRGVDVVGAATRTSSRRPSRVTRRSSRRHGTRMAGIVAGAGGRAASGRCVRAHACSRSVSWAGARPRTETGPCWDGRLLLAGLERAVDPDGDGDVEDGAAVALAAVVSRTQPSPDSPESRAVAGRRRLGTLVVAPVGNDGRPDRVRQRGSARSGARGARRRDARRPPRGASGRCDSSEPAPTRSWTRRFASSA